MTIANYERLVDRCRMLGVLHVANRVSREVGIPLQAMLSASRSGTLVRARRALYLALRAEGLSYQEIGRCVGRDHTTIIAALKGRASDQCAQCGKPIDQHAPQPDLAERVRVA
jgi:chromosomal replication initiation ATPase DnaA